MVWVLEHCEMEKRVMAWVLERSHPYRDEIRFSPGPSLN
jgi:hypothetical protein